MPARRCKGTNKAGEPCGCAPLRDRDYCATHDPDLPESMRFKGGAKPGAGRPPSPRAVDVLRERIEQDIDQVLRPLFEGLHAEKSVVVGNGPSAHVESVPDQSTQIAAARELLDRAYGRPKQATEITGADGAPLAIQGEVLLADESLSESLRLVRERLAAQREQGDEEEKAA